MWTVVCGDVVFPHNVIGALRLIIRTLRNDGQHDSSVLFADDDLHSDCGRVADWPVQNRSSDISFEPPEKWFAISAFVGRSTRLIVVSRTFKVFPMTASPVISVQDFHKAYEGAPAVQGITFSIEPGQVMGVIGPNGAGKTTTMRALSAIIPPTHGELSVAGFDVERDPVAVKRRLAYVPDDPRLFPPLTVEEHLAFTAAAYQVNHADEKAATLLEQFELLEKRKTAARDLSRGMRQKLAICCAWLYEPVALLLDEPLTGLDPAGIRMLKQSLVDRAARGAAVMISSHLLAMVEDVCTHILLLDRGHQKFFGTVKELRQQFGGQDAATSLEQIFFAVTGDVSSSVDSHRSCATTPV